VLLCCAPLAFGSTIDSSWSVRPWQSDEGLPNNQVTGLAQTADGYIWVATPSRVVRFDGVSFEDFPLKNLVPGFAQKPAVLLATRNGLWVGFDHGAVIFFNGDTPRVVSKDLPDRVPQTLTETTDGTLWITYRAGVTYRITGEKARLCTAQEGFPSGYVCSLTTDTTGQLWFGKSGRVGVFHEGHFLTQVEFSRQTCRIAAARTGGLWICAGRQLFRYRRGSSAEPCGEIVAGATTEPTALLEDRNGGVWIGTSDNGLFHFDGKNFESVAISRGAISTLLEDREGSLWVGIDGGGLNRVRPRAVHLENAATGLPADTIQSIAEDTRGIVWLTTQTGLLVRQASAGWEIVSQQTDWPGGRPTCIAPDADGGMWIATKDNVVHHWQAGRFTSVRRGDGLLSRTVHALVVDRNGDVWLGEESPDILQRLRHGELKTFPLPAGIRVIRAMAEDDAGDIWLGTSKGMLLRIHAERVIDETARIVGKNTWRSIRYLRPAPGGRLWIAYADEGLGLYQNGRFANLTAAQGLPDNNLSQVISDGRGWLWIGGDHGLFKAREEELENVAWGRAQKVRVVRYGRNEGLASLQANFGDSPAALRTRDGRILMPLRTALAVIDPTQVHEDAPPPPVVVTAVLVNDVVVARFGGIGIAPGEIDLRQTSNPLRLAADHRRLEINYTALSYVAPENVRFQYRLEGFDDDWVDAGTQRNARYPRLPAGSYRFRVKACNSDGVWNDAGAGFAFTVAPFFWQTWWFRLVGAAVLLAGTVAIVRIVSLRRLRRRLRSLEEQTTLDRERARIARDMHDDLGSRLTHLTLLVELAQRAAVDNRDARLNQIASTVRRASESLDEIVWAVNPGNDVFPRLIHYVSQYAVEFLGVAGIRCRIDLPDRLPNRAISPELRHNLFLVLKEALTNVARHAQATEVWLRATIGNDGFTLMIEDNGRGFSEAPDDGRADGLRNMQTRMKDCGGRLEITSAPGAGARLLLVIAWPRENIQFAAPAAQVASGRPLVNHA
jgi:ligand-binding sensor domain-containing protein/signal transduction histidine kinase